MNYCQIQSDIEMYAKDIVEKFTLSQTSLAGAESCTGGAVASAIVSIPNASKVFKGSAICYCDDAKQDILSVDSNILKTFFAESPQCAEAMATNAQKIYKSDIAFATTGFLDDNIGKHRPDSLKGKVFIAVVKNNNEEQNVLIREVSLDVSQPRNYNRMICVLTVLKMILEN